MADEPANDRLEESNCATSIAISWPRLSDRSAVTASFLDTISSIPQNGKSTSFNVSSRSRRMDSLENRLQNVLMSDDVPLIGPDFQVWRGGEKKTAPVISIVNEGHHVTV